MIPIYYITRLKKISLEKVYIYFIISRVKLISPLYLLKIKTINYNYICFRYVFSIIATCHKNNFQNRTIIIISFYK